MRSARPRPLTRLRPLARPLAAASACLALATAAAAPSATAQTPAWHDAEAGIPTDVHLYDVAVYPPRGAVVAVGARTGPAGPPQAVLFTAIGGAWTEASPLSMPRDSRLASVAVTAGAAWAVGTYDLGGAPKPFAVRLPGGGDALGSAAEWSVIDLPTALDRPATAVALWGAQGFLGDDAGRLHPVDDADPAGVREAVEPVPAAESVNAIALLGPQGGFAAADRPSEAADPAARIYKLFPSASGHALVSDAASPSGVTHDVRSIAATAADSALAVDAGAGVWQLSPGATAWTRTTGASFPAAGSDLRDVAMLPLAGSARLEMIAGGFSGDGAVWHGAVWRRDAGSAWSRTELPAASRLNGLAIAAPEDVWAVGDGGTVVRYWRKPVAPVTDPGTDPGGTDPGGADPGGSDPLESDPGAGGAGAGAGSGSSPQESSGPRRASPVPDIDVEVTPPPVAEPPDAARRLLKGVKVSRGRKRTLIVRFKLIERARVALVARRGRRVVARRKLRTLRGGRHRMVVRYRGRKLPTSLKLVVRPASQKRSGSAARTAMVSEGGRR